jgi:preprotein translocase subunit SecG
MNILYTLIIFVQVAAALGIIGLVLLQHGKGADMGASFGSGSSGSLFGATGSANFLSRTTAILAAVFMVTTLALAYVATKNRGATPGGGLGVMEGVQGTTVGKDANKDAKKDEKAPASGPAAVPGQSPAPAAPVSTAPGSVPAPSVTPQPGAASTAVPPATIAPGSVPTPSAPPAEPKK